MTKKDEEQAQSLLPIAIFMDTNILDSLPATLESGSLQSFVSEAKSLNLEVYIPDIVEREWIQHRLEHALDSLVKSTKCMKHLSQHSENWIQIDLASTEILAETVKTKAHERLKCAGFIILDPPQIDIVDVSDRAAQKLLPFQNANKGFKDELIVLTMLELMAEYEFHSVLLVSNDKVFSNNDIATQYAQYGAQYGVTQYGTIWGQVWFSV